MPEFGFYAGDTNKTIYVRLRDSTTGLAKTGLVFNSAGASAYYTLPGAAAAAITLATQTVTGAHSDGGFVEVDATNAKGLYRLDLPDAAIASGDYSLISIEFDGVIEETALIPLAVPKANVTQVNGTAVQSMLVVDIEPPPKILIPKTGSLSYHIHILVRDETNTLLDADSTPTITQFIDEDGTDLSSRLGAVSNISAGRYRVTYTSAAADVPAQLRLTITAVKSGYTGGVGENTLMLEDKPAVNEKRTWYIDGDLATGNNDGTSRVDAWQTLADFDNNLVEPGDDVYMYGTFTGEPISFNVRGLTIFAAGCVIDGTGDTEVYNVRLNAHHQTLIGGEYKNCQGTGANGKAIIVNSAHHCRIKSVLAHDATFTGIQAKSARGLVVEDCEVYDNTTKGFEITNATAVSPDPDNTDITVRFCRVHGNGRFGLQFGAGNGQTKGRNVQVYGNKIYSNGGGISAEEGFHDKIFDNDIYDNDDTTDGTANQNEIEINGGSYVEIFNNRFSSKAFAGHFIEFLNDNTTPDNHHIHDNVFLHDGTPVTGIQLQKNGTDGNKFNNNTFVITGSAQADRAIVVCQGTNGQIVGNVFVGGGEQIKLNSVSAVAITATDWTISQNVFDGPNTKSIATGGTADATLSGNTFINQQSTFVTLGGTNYTVSTIGTKDTTWSNNDPNYQGPTAGYVLDRNYRWNKDSVELEALEDDWADAGRLDTILDAVATTTDLGTPVSLGDGATIADMLTAIAGKTANAGSYNRTTDSNEAIRDQGVNATGTVVIGNHVAAVGSTSPLTASLGVTIPLTVAIAES